MANTINNTSIVKKTNEETIIEALLKTDAATISFLSQQTGLSAATCGNILHELKERGEVMEMEPSASTGGRKARQFTLNADSHLVLGISVKTEGGVHSIDVALADWHGDYVEKDSRFYDVINYDLIERLTDEWIRRFPNIKAIGMGVQGVVSHGVIGICDTEELCDIPIQERLEARYSVKVNVENEMHYALYGFYRDQQYTVPKTIAMAAFVKDNPPGARFVIDGRLVKGNTQFAGEISYIPFESTRKQQLEKLYSPDSFPELAVKMTSAMISIINPQAIAFIGELSKGLDMEQVYEACSAFVPKEHMPELILIDDIQPYYQKGLTAITLKSLRFPLHLAERELIS